MKLLTQVLAVFCCMTLCMWSCAGGSSPTEDTPADEVLSETDLDDVPADTPDIPVESDIPGPDLDVPADGDVGDPGAEDIRPEDVAAEDGSCTVGLTGDPCSSPTACACVPSSARECLTTLSGYITFPGGYCSARCTTPADCGTGANCAEITTGTRYCLKVCSSASQCRMAEGYTCTQIPMSSDTRTYCLPQGSPDGAG
ncbi:MAG: hypothetical protein ABIJ56_16245 [Pseudomonadota bacterium]